ncbi:TauD/TfdA family dioxygenase [Streptomyces sp. NPDC058369]|uniref:TauD/TfdA family dioxygenase n=1 Tax=unclassified Streptomyces TaxID=2593676 RepID=UPI00345521A0
MTPDALVESGPLLPGGTLPVHVRPLVADVDLTAWVKEHRDTVEAHLTETGGILFRGFGVRGAAEFEQVVSSLYPDLVGEHERSSPRHQVSGHVFTSTDHPADQTIFLHNEMSYSSTWPMRIAFHCVTAAETGGETPIASTREVLRLIPQDIREQFEARKVMYVRNYNEGFGLPWQTSFQTDDPAVVDAYCREAGMQAEWKGGGRLCTRVVGEAIRRHPVTGERVWFNHATFFHVSTLEPVLRDALLADFAEDDLPTNSFYGDGSPIEPDVLDILRDAYRQATVAFPWQRGDVLLLDNMLAAHARSPYTGARKIVVSMAQPLTTDTSAARA